MQHINRGTGKRGYALTVPGLQSQAKQDVSFMRGIISIFGTGGMQKIEKRNSGMVEKKEPNIKDRGAA